MVSESYRNYKSYANNRDRRRADNQDMLQDHHHHTTIATSRTHLRATATLSTRKSISHISMTTKRWQEKEFHRHQQRSLHHQPSLNHLLTKKNDKDNRSWLTKQEKRGRANMKNTGTSSQKIFPRGIAAHYQFLSQSIITDLERAIENIIPPTTNVMIHYRITKERLLNKFRPNSQNDAEETRRKLDSLHGDLRGWDIYLATLDVLIYNISYILIII